MTETSWQSRIHPELREALDLLPARVIELGERTTDPPALRKELAVVTEAAAAAGYPPPPPRTVTIENLEVSDGPGSESVGLRIYPRTERPAHAVPAVIHFHGGGFMIGQPEDDDIVVTRTSRLMASPSFPCATGWRRSIPILPRSPTPGTH